MLDYVRTNEDWYYWPISVYDSNLGKCVETGDLVPYSRHQDECFADRFDGGDSDDPYPYPAVIPVLLNPNSGDANWKIDQAWWNFWRDVVVIYGGGWAAWEAVRRNNGGIINWAANNNYPGGIPVPDPPDNGWPIMEGITSAGNYHKLLGIENGSYKIAALNYWAGPPDIKDVNPVKTPWYFNRLRGISNKGILGNAPDGQITYTPIVVKNIRNRGQDYLYIPMEKATQVAEIPSSGGSTNMELSLVRDFARYQWPVNFKVMHDNGVMMVIMRAAISYGYIDPFFSEFWKGAEPYYAQRRSSYHVIYPDQAVLGQADKWYEAHPTRDVVPRVIDLELDRGRTANEIADKTWEMSNIVLARDGIRPLIYSRRLLINEWLASWTTEMLNAHKWWLAQYWSSGEEYGYATGEDRPTLPNRILRANVLLHQTTDTKPGFPGEVGSAAVDWDRWQPDVSIADYAAAHWGGVIEPTPPPDVDVVAIRNQALDDAAVAADQAIRGMKA